MSELLTKAAASTFGKQYIDKKYRKPDYNLESIKDSSKRCIGNMCNVIIIGFDDELKKDLKSHYLKKKKSNLIARMQETYDAAIEFGENQLEKDGESKKELCVLQYMLFLQLPK